MNNNCNYSYINSLNDALTNLGERINIVDDRILTLPYFITNFSSNCPGTIINWNTVTANPSNASLQRIWNITLSAVTKSPNVNGKYSSYVFTFLPTERVPINVTFEGGISGTINYNGQVLDASQQWDRYTPLMSYSYNNKEPGIFWEITVNLPTNLFTYNGQLQYNIWVKDNVGSASTTFQWDTTTPTLNYGGNNVQLRGFSLTGTEYISSLYPYDTFYDFTNNCITTNFTSFINTMVQISNNTNVIPALRIPLCADYFLAGSATAGVGCNISFTATQYQQMVATLIATATSNGSSFTVSDQTPSNYPTSSTNTTTVINGVPNAVIILDLHWSYSTESPKQSANGTAGVNFNSGQQLPLPGVFLSNGTESGTLTDNTLDFWTAIASIFGVNSDGQSLYDPNGTYSSLSTEVGAISADVFSNIFFELYNEPICDQLTTDSTGGYVNNFSYQQYYQAYINGGEYYQQGTNSYAPGATNNLFSFTGFGTMFCTIRQTEGASNICIFGGSDQYSFLDLSLSYPTGNSAQPGQFNYANGGSNGAPGQSSSSTTIYDTYNCWTCVMDAITNTNTNPGTTNQVVTSSGGSTYFSAQNFNNCLINIHPYVGLYSGATKAPGLYNVDGYGTYNALPGFGQLVSCLQNSSFTNFYMSTPIICTEFGSYDLPWSAFYGTASSNPLTYCYNVTGSDTATINNISYTNPNIQYPNPPNQGSGTVTLGTPYYTGNWISSATGALTYGPPLLGYLEDFSTFNISFCIWAYRPNEGGNGSGATDAYGFGVSDFGWSGTNPDIVSGTSTTVGNLITNAEGTYLNSFVTTSTQSQTQYPEFENSSSAGAGSGTDPYNGIDFQYVFNNYF